MSCKAELFAASSCCGIDFSAKRSGGGRLVLVASANVGGVDLTAELLPEVEAAFHGVDSIRIHTARPGLIRKLIKHGYQPTEMVMVKKVVKNV